MNPLVFERSSGRLGPNEFARIQTTSLLRSFSAGFRFRFDGGERAASDTAGHAGGSSTVSATDSLVSGDDAGPRASLWAHQAGVSALALERFDGRMCVVMPLNLGPCVF